MPKLLICASETKKKDRKAATSAANLKKLIEKRIEKDAADSIYTVITLNTKMKLANVVSLINSSTAKLAEHEGVQTVEKWTVHPDKTRGKWEIETLSVAKTPAPLATDESDSEEKSEKKAKKKAKKKKKLKKKEGK